MHQITCFTTQIPMTGYNFYRSKPFFACNMQRFILLITFSLWFASAQAQYRDYYKEGNAYMNKKQFALAEETFAMGIQVDSSLHILYTSLANAMMMQKKYNQADSVLEIVLEKNASFLGAFWFKGLNYFYWGEDSLSVIYMKRFIKSAPPQNNQVTNASF